MMNLVILGNGSQKVLECRMNARDADTFVVEMVKNNEIPGLARASYSLADTQLIVRYDIGGMVSAEEILQTSGDIRILLEVLEGVAKALSNLDNYMLDQGCLMFDLNYIFWSEETRKAVMIALPIEAGGIDVRAFLRYMLKRYSFHGTRSNEILRKVQMFVETDALTDGEKMLTFLNSIHLSKESEEALGPAYIIYVKTGEKIYLESDHFSLGRQWEANDFVVESAKRMSRVHAVILRRENVYYLKDENSKNHTFLNGEDIGSGQSRLLADGDEFRLATEIFRFGRDPISASLEGGGGGAAPVRQDPVSHPTPPGPTPPGPSSEWEEEPEEIPPEERISLYDLLSRYNSERAAEYKRQRAIEKEIKKREKAQKKAGKPVKKGKKKEGGGGMVIPKK